MQHEQSDRGQEPSPRPSSVAPASHSLASPVLRFDLPAEAETLRQRESYGNRRPTGRTLVKEPDLRIVLMALKAGGRFEEHHASGPISVQVLDGAIRLRMGENAVDLSAGNLLALEPGVAHDVDALEDSAFLLTIGRTRYHDVSDRHELHT